jgi:hypothetical protein
LYHQLLYGGWIVTFLCVKLALATTQQSAIWHVVGLSSCRLVASDNTTKRQTARCRFIVLSSQARHPKRRIVVRPVVAMSPCRLTYKPILQFEPSDNVTSRQHAARQRAVWRAALETEGQGDNASFCALSCCR